MMEEQKNKPATIDEYIAACPPRTSRFSSG